MKKIFLMVFITLSFATENEISQQTKDYRLESFFNAIKIYNNKYASTFITGYKEDTVYKNNNTFDVYTKSSAVVEVDKIDINKKNINGYTAAIIAAEYNNDTILKELIEHGVDLNVSHPILGRTILNTAVYFESYNVVKLLLETNKDLVNETDPLDGWTPLMIAVLKNNKNILNLLLENGANISLKDHTGADAIDLAVKYGKGQIIKILRDSKK